MGGMRLGGGSSSPASKREDFPVTPHDHCKKSTQLLAPRLDKHSIQAGWTACRCNGAAVTVLRAKCKIESAMTKTDEGSEKNGQLANLG